MPNDCDDSRVRDEILADGEAALFFVESLALKLIEKNVLSADEVIQALEVAEDAMHVAAEDGNAPRLSIRAATLSQVMNSVSALEKLPPVKS